MGVEKKRLQENKEKKKHWYRFGPYLSSRQWGTVREDQSLDGDAWNSFPFKEAGKRPYEWGEDGILGLSDNHQRLCFAPCFYNGQDEIIKERLFGLSNPQGNHGEDVKEIYYFLDNTPTHSYMRGLYKYPQKAFPYKELVEENARRSQKEPEYELIDTGIFDENRYFDIFVEYAKLDAEDIAIRITVHNRGPDLAMCDVMPKLWARKGGSFSRGEGFVTADISGLGLYTLYFPETTRIKTVDDKKALLLAPFNLPAGESGELVLRLTTDAGLKAPLKSIEKEFAKRQKEADEFYGELLPKKLSSEHKSIERQAIAGMLWNKQFYNYVVEEWLRGRKNMRNSDWPHLYNDDILSVPDNWEYPAFFSWDSAFHMLPLSAVDPEFAKRQLLLLTREWYMHPSGQIPAYEWDFNDVNPPVHAWSAYRVYKIDERRHGTSDVLFLERIFQKLLLNFTWWVNRKDVSGKNIFAGGFLGLDNISVFNRSEDLPPGCHLYQSDATSWMGMYCLNMLQISLELAKHNPSYEDMASKFYEHFLYIADAINYEVDETHPLWNEEDGFYYDVLTYPDGSSQYLRVRSLVGLLPLLGVVTISPDVFDYAKGFKKRLDWFLNHRHDLCDKVACMKTEGVKGRRLLSLVTRERLERLLSLLLDENEFLSPYGIRSLSKYHKDNPYKLKINEHEYSVDYEPGESTLKLFGGNSNWRGPIWFPINILIIESLQKYHHYIGDDFKVEFPTGSGNFLNLWDVSLEISKRLLKIFDKDDSGQRPVYAHREKFQNDPHFSSYVHFHEYFNGDTGEGLGASHQTGWTGLIAKILQQLGEYS